MAITLLGTPLDNVGDGDSYTPETGSDRQVVSLSGARVIGTTGVLLSSETYDGVAMTLDATDWRVQGGSNSLIAAISSMLEADLPAGSAAIVRTWSTDTPDLEDGWLATLAGVDQTTPLVAAQAANENSSSDLLLSFAVEEDGFVAIGVLSQADITTPAGYTLQRHAVISGSTRFAVYTKAILADGTENVTIVSPHVKVAAAGSYRAAAVATMAITDVDTDETLVAGQTGIAVTGTDMGTTNANREFTILQGAVEIAQTETGVGTATAATLTLVMETVPEDLKFGAATLRVTRDDLETDDIAITLNPASGETYVDVGTPNTEATDRITAVADIASGDQLHAQGVGGGAAPTGLVLNTDATFYFTSGNTPTDFDVRVWSATSGVWGAFATQTVAVTDTASGAATLPVPTAAGTAELTRKAQGAATLPALTAAGSAVVTRKAQGAATLPAPTASGTATVSGDNPTATGAPSLPGVTAAGAASLTRKASGAATLPGVLAAGTARVVRKASGVATLPGLTASGSGEVVQPQTAEGAAELPFPIASGSARIIHRASGAAVLPGLVAIAIEEVPEAGTRTEAMDEVTVMVVAAEPRTMRVPAESRSMRATRESRLMIVS